MVFIKKDSTKHFIEICLTLFPFFVFAFFYIIFSPLSSWHNYLIFNKIISFIFLIGLFFSTIFKKYKKNFFYVYLSFSVFFSSAFILINPSRSWIEMQILDFLPLHTLENVYSKYILFPNLFFFGIFIVLTVIAYFAYRLLNLDKTKMFLFCFSYFYTYCFFASLQYLEYLIPKEYSITVTGNGFKQYIILNSILSLLFLIVFFILKKRITKTVSFISFIILNFIVLHFHFIMDLLKGINLFQYNLLTLIKSYFLCFLLFSNLIYFCIFLAAIGKYQSTKLFFKKLSKKIDTIQ